MRENNSKVINTNLGILLICLFSAVFTMADFIIINSVLDKYVDYSKCECAKCDVKDNSVINDNKVDTTVIDDKKDDVILEDDGVVIQDDEIKNTIESIMEKYYTTVSFNIKCGEKDFDDVYYPNDGSFPDYIRCLEYNSIDELKQYYNTFLSEEFYSEMVDLSFIEHDNKLYCKAHHTAPYTYEVGSFEVVSMKENGNGITATGFYRTKDTGLYPTYTFDVSLDLIYNNDDILVLNKVEERMRNS